MKSFKTLANNSSVCKAFETDRRRSNVSFEMHQGAGKAPRSQAREVPRPDRGWRDQDPQRVREKVRPAKKVKPVKTAGLLIIKVEGRSFQVNDPLPTWHVMKGAGQEYLGCTQCWTVSGPGYDAILLLRRGRHSTKAKRNSCASARTACVLRTPVKEGQ